MDMRMLTAAMAMRADQRGPAIEAEGVLRALASRAVPWFNRAPDKLTGGNIAGRHSPVHERDQYHRLLR